MQCTSKIELACLRQPHQGRERLTVCTPAILLDVSLTVRTLLCGPPNRQHRLVLFLDSVLDSQLIIGAGFTVMPWSVTRDTSPRATFFAFAGVRRHLALLSVILEGYLLRFGRRLQLCQSIWFPVDLASATVWIETPAPSWRVVGLYSCQCESRSWCESD